MRIELQDIHKYYGPVKANNGISLTVEPGTIHGILGENGAGKSTLMKILAGYSSRTSGRVLIDGVPVYYSAPAEASRLGIGMLYQDPLDFPRLSVLDNFMLGQSRGLFAHRHRFKKEFLRFCQRLNFALPPDAPVGSLTVGERQQLEIVRLLALGCGTLILDEPTSGISSIQKEILFAAFRKLTVENKSVILVSHKLEEVETLCDRVTVLRQGIVAGEMKQPLDAHALLEMMFGAAPPPPVRRATAFGSELLSLRDVSAPGGRTGLLPCNLAVKRGEVIGLAGLEGSGQGVFLRAACGLAMLLSGDIHLNGQNLTRKNYHVFKSAGVRFMPASRLEEGLIGNMTLAEHFALQEDRKSFWVHKQKALRKAETQIRTFQIKATSETPVQSLSGGNQQRLLLSFLPEDPVLLLLENPTRGLDLESTQWVWRHLLSHSIRNTAIIFSSPELEEIMMIAQRVLVFYNGRIVKDAQTRDISIQEVGQAIAGKI